MKNIILEEDRVGFYRRGYLGEFSYVGWNPLEHRYQEFATMEEYNEFFDTLLKENNN
jgi:hypothetical protein